MIAGEEMNVAVQQMAAEMEEMKRMQDRANIATAAKANPDNDVLSDPHSIHNLRYNLPDSEPDSNYRKPEHEHRQIMPNCNCDSKP